jgi:hypothetical protein
MAAAKNRMEAFTGEKPCQPLWATLLFRLSVLTSDNPLDRAGCTLTHLIDLLRSLKERNIGFISLTEQIDTTIP